MVLVACHLVAEGQWKAGQLLSMHPWPTRPQCQSVWSLIPTCPFDRQTLFQHLLQLRGHAGDHEALCGVPRRRAGTAGRSLTVPSGVGASCRGSLCLLGCHLPAPGVVAAWQLCPACGSFKLCQSLWQMTGPGWAIGWFAGGWHFPAYFKQPSCPVPGDLL